MTNQATIKAHATLMDDMATTVDVDLEQAMLEGRMTMDQLSDAVLSCTGCTHPQECARWQAAQTGPVSATPEYCRNGDMLGRLAAGKSA